MSPEGPVAAGTGRPAPLAVLVDIDDTLVDTRSAFRAAMAAVLDTWLGHLVAAEREAATTHWVSDPLGHFRAYTRGEHDFATARRLRAIELHRVFGGPGLDGPMYQEWNLDYERAFRAAWAPHADAAALFDALAAAGVAVGAVTNMQRAYQQAKLAVVGLGDRVEILAAVDDLGVGKPDPRVFALACERAGAAPARVAYVGDELDVDARGARDAGLIGVWLDRGGVSPPPDDVPVVAGLGELPGLLGLTGARAG